MKLNSRIRSPHGGVGEGLTAPGTLIIILLTILQPMDLTCVETQIGDGGKLDCEIVDLDTTELMYRVKLPTL